MKKLVHILIVSCLLIIIGFGDVSRASASIEEMNAEVFMEDPLLDSEEIMKEMNLIDAGLVSMQLMLAARAHGYDTNPIGGYEKEETTKAFGMDVNRYVPVMLISIGKAAEEGYESVRLPIDTIAEWKNS